MFGHVESESSLAKYPSSDDAVQHSAEIPGRGHGIAGESELEHFGALYGACDAMKTLFRQIERLARSTAPVIILGESGSGKELVATTLHQLSPRADRPFIAINCGAIAETLIESELFGHERGSFTGASRTHRGCFERASGGTLFLDEITEMPIDMQVRLLRVLETGRFSRVGGDNEISTDVRVLAASNRDLQQAVASGRLREDLMYRLCVIPLSVPPLRERNDDALLLADMFLRNLNDEHAESKQLRHAGKGVHSGTPLAGKRARIEERHSSRIRAFGRRSAGRHRRRCATGMYTSTARRHRGPYARHFNIRGVFRGAHPGRNVARRC